MRVRAKHLVSFLILFLPLQLSALTPTQAQLKAEHNQLLSEMNVKDAKGKLPDFDDPRMPSLLKHGWTIAGEWAAEYFERHEAPTKKDLDKLFDGFAPEPHGTKSEYGDFLEYTDYFFEGSAVRIGPSVYVVEASYGYWFRSGTFMVVGRNRGGHFEALWNIKDLAEKHYPQRDEIGRWMHLVRHAYYNGPLAVDHLLPLPVGTNGKARFLVNAYQAADGGTLLAQLSIWEWDGAEAKALLIDTYEYAADFGGFSFDGRTILIKTKEPLELLYSCGMCPDPRGTWRLRATSTGIENLGHHFSQPEIQWADHFLSKVFKGEDTSDLADKKARVAVDASPQDWGMLGTCRVLRRGQHGAFSIEVDAGKLTFHYILRHGKPYFTGFRFDSVG